jgi:hypothetical protein
MKPDAVWDVLVEMAGAREEERAQFVHHAETTKPGDLEYRFMGKLGFGGKVWSLYNGGWRIDCYLEDSTPARRKIIEAVNAKIGGAL